MRRAAFALGSLVVAAVSCLPGCSRGDEPRRDRKAAASPPSTTVIDGAGDSSAIRDCEESVSGDLGRRWRDQTVLVGPAGFVARGYANAPRSDFAETPHGSRRYRGQKVLLLVRRGTTVTVQVLPHVRAPRASLLYDPVKWNDRNTYRVADGDAAMTFRACDGLHGVLPQNYTQFNGSFVVAGAGCVHVDVHVPGEPRRYRAVLSFGAGRCA